MRRGFEVVGQATDGAEAVKVAQEVRPDVILMDVYMPNMDGIEACREIMELLPGTKVLMLTAATETDAVINAVAAGATGYLQKYTGREHLLGVMRTVAIGEYHIPSSLTGQVFAGIRARNQHEANRDTAKLTDGRTRDPHAVLAGDVVLGHRRCSGQSSADHPKHHLPHSGQARRQVETAVWSSGPCETA